jgi:ADP-L-glycero-D-manno-heptose 6-epimerase
MYGYSKHLFDLHAKRQGWLRRIVGLKYFNVFGPNEDHKADMRSVVHKAFGQITSTGRLSLFKSHRPDYRDGEQKRDFLYVKDAVRMTLQLAQAPLAAGLFAALGRPPAIDFIDMPEALREKYQYFTCADIARLRQSGYADTLTPLTDSVRDYVTNYLQHDRRLGDEPTPKA